MWALNLACILVYDFCPIRLQLAEREQEINDLELKMEKVSPLNHTALVQLYSGYGLVSYTAVMVGS